MNDSDSANNDLNNPEMPLDVMVERTSRSLREQKAIGAWQLFDAADYPVSTKHTASQVEEDNGFYIPDIVSEEGFRANPEYFSAALGHAKDLSKVQRLLGDALDLVRQMSAELCDECDNPLIRAETTRAAIEKKLSKAYVRIRKHDRHHTNLFLAYFDLKGRMDTSADASTDRM